MSEASHFISSETLKAYQEAVFSIFNGEKLIQFKAGLFSQEILTFIKQENIQSAALITAYNPYSKPLSKVENEAAQAKLIERLNELSIRFFRGEGRDAAGLWEPEPSVLALDISLETADKLAMQFEQNAYVWINGDGLPTLKLMFPVSNNP